IGAAVQGDSQSRCVVDDLTTYNFEQEADSITSAYNVFGLVFDFGRFIRSAPASPTNTAQGWNVISGNGDLQYLEPVTNCTGTGGVYLTNLVRAPGTNGTSEVTFKIRGGTNGGAVGVVGWSEVTNSIAGSRFYWQGQVTSCRRYRLYGQPNQHCFYMLGASAGDTDGDGLSDQLETIVSKTSITNAFTFGTNNIPEAWLVLHALEPASGTASLDPDRDGLSNLGEYLFGTDPNVSEGFGIWLSSPGGGSPVA